MRRSSILTTAALLSAGGMLAAGCSFETDGAREWPGRQPIYIAVFASAGGATDLGNRALAAALERELGATFTVLNMAGAQGGAAAAYAWNAPRNGHVWFGTSEGSLGLAVLGAHTTSAKDWNYFVLGGTPGILSVPASSPYQTVEQLIEDVRSRPNQVRMASSFRGTAWHVQYLALTNATDFDVRWISYQGSYPSQVAALSGEVDVVLTGLGEQAEYLRAGRLRALATIRTEAHELEGVGSIRPITEAVPEMTKVLPLHQWVGFALPADTPPEIISRVEAAFQRAMAAEEVRNHGRHSHSELLGLYGEEANEMVRKQERVIAWSLYDAGLATHSPADFGIERP